MTLVDVYYKYQKEYSEKYGNKTIVLMEVGSFYEMYATKEDSSYIKNVCDLLNILLTRKNKNIPVSPKNPYMGGIVSTSIDKYMRVLLEHNYTVVLVEQLNPNPPCKRAVTRICSPSTTISYLAEPARLNCLVIDGTKHIGMVSIDISTGTSYYHEVILPKNQYNSSWIIQEFVRFWSSLPCKEFLWYTVNELSDDGDLQSKSNTSHNMTSDKEMWLNATKWDKEPELLEHMSINQQNTILSKYYPDTKMLTPIEYLDMETSPLSVLAYIKAMQFEYEHDKLVTQYMAKPVKYDLSNTMNLAHHTISRLHLQSKEEISLLTIINKTKTALGKRLLEERLLHPSIDVDEINQRYDNIENMSDVSKDLQIHLEQIPDLIRCKRKMLLEKFHPYEFISLWYSFSAIDNIVDILNKSNAKYLLPSEEDCKDFNNWRKEIKSKVYIEKIDNTSIDNINNNFFKSNVNKDLDELELKMKKIKSYLEKVVLEFSNQLDPNKMSVRLDHNEKDGHRISITKVRWKRLQQVWKDITVDDITIKLDDIFADTRHSDVRLTGKWIDTMSRKYGYLIDDYKRLVKDCYLEFIREVGSYKKMDVWIDFIAEVDFVQSAIQIAETYKYTKPILIKKDYSYFDVKDIRHPITETLFTDTEFVTNDISLGESGIVITGMNGVGKSVLLKSMGTVIVMAQAGLYVPCSGLTFSPYKEILTRIGNADDLLRGHSTFVCEMLELYTILNRANKNTLILADELCSGSEQMSAQAIVVQTILSLLEKKSSFCITTHWHGLHELPDIKEKINKNLSFKYLTIQQIGDKIIYERKLKDGVSISLYGIEVAKSILHDSEFIQNAFKIRSTLMNEKTGKSHYNSQVIMEKCQICNSTNNLETHHIHSQALAKDNYINEFVHKNHKSNLVVLCGKHHHDVHSGGLVINGWKHTTDGVILDYSFNQKMPDTVVKKVEKSIMIRI